MFTRRAEPLQVQADDGRVGPPLRPQLCVHEGDALDTKVRPVRNDLDELSKPRGGLWTSTYSPGFGSSWVCWCMAYRYGEPLDLRWTVLSVAETARIASVDSATDLAELIDRYPRVLNGQSGLDFELLSRDFDGIHLSLEGYLRTRTAKSKSAVAGWDCESTLWLRWAFARHCNVQPCFRNLDYYDRLWHTLSGWSMEDYQCHLMPEAQASQQVYQQILHDCYDPSRAGHLDRRERISL